MKIVVTGATGFIGRHVLQTLLKQGHDILVVGRTEPHESGKYRFIQSNLLEKDSHAWLVEYRPSHLMHLAWYAEHGKFWTSHINLEWCDATIRLVKSFCEAGGKKVVVAGSCAEYDWSIGYCKENSTPTNPSTLYGITKDCTRRMLEELCKSYNTSLSWGRVFLPFGVGENPNKLIPSIAQALVGKRPSFSVNSQQWRDFLPVENVADSLIHLLNRDVSGIFNLSSGRPTQICDLVNHIAEVLNQDPSLILFNDRIEQNQSNFLVGDNTSLFSIGWSPTYDLWERLDYYVNTVVSV